MLVLSGGAKKVVVINQDHEVFLGEGLGDATFEFMAEPMTFTQESELRKRFVTYRDGAEIPDSAAFLKAMFQKVVVGWKGIAFSDRGDVECTAENKAIAFDSNFDFFSKVLKAIRMESDKIGAVKAEAAKN